MSDMEIWIAAALECIPNGTILKMNMSQAAYRLMHQGANKSDIIRYWYENFPEQIAEIENKYF